MDPGSRQRGLEEEGAQAGVDADVGAVVVAAGHRGEQGADGRHRLGAVPTGEPIQLSNAGDGAAVVYVTIRAGFEAKKADGTAIGTPPWAKLIVQMQLSGNRRLTCESSGGGSRSAVSRTGARRALCAVAAYGGD